MHCFGSEVFGMLERFEEPFYLCPHLAEVECFEGLVVIVVLTARSDVRRTSLPSLFEWQGAIVLLFLGPVLLFFVVIGRTGQAKSCTSYVWENMLIVNCICFLDSFLGNPLLLRCWFYCVFSQIFYDSFDENWDGRWIVSQSSDYGGNILRTLLTHDFSC